MSVKVQGRSGQRSRVVPVAAGDRRGQIIGHWRHDGERAAVGVGDRETGAVEGEAVEVVVGAEDAVVLALAVADVADERAADVLEVAADLVEPAGVEAGLDEGVAAEAIAKPDLGARVDASFAGRAWDGGIDQGVIGRMAARDREVALVGVGPGEGEGAGGCGVDGEQDETGGAAVEAVDGVDVGVDGAAHALEEGVVAVVPAAVGRDAGRFVDDDAPGVAVNDHGGPRCWRKKSTWTCSRARARRGSGSMCVAERVTTSARLPAT